MRTNISTEVNKKPITFSEMGEFIQLYNRLDKPQKEKLSKYWAEITHDLPITPQKVVNLKKKDYQEILEYTRLLLITY
ncbi:9407_t:CDS:1, partial [Funneliformis geosporum]